MKEARKSSRPVAAPTILCTVASNSHLSYAAAMMQSARTTAPDLRRIIFLCDEPSPGHSDIDLPADIVPIVDVLGATFNDMVIRYTPFLTCAASKPCIFRFLFSQPQVERIIYLDSDILVFSPPKEVERALATTADLVLTPHTTAPLSDGLRPNDLDILKAGVWNTGFLAMRRSPAVDAFIDWWAAMCETLTLIDIPGNLFAEQRWVDMAPAFVRRTKRLLHPGYNAAYWNLGQRKVAKAADGSWRVNADKALRFFHFSGIVPNDPSIISKYQDRFRADELGPAGELFDLFRSSVMKNGWERTHALPWAGSRTQSGRVIPNIARSLFQRRFRKSQASRFKSWREGLDWFVGWFDGPDVEFNRGLTRLMSAIYQSREDLRTLFDVRNPDGVQSFHQWFAEKAGAEYGTDAGSLQAARRLSDSLQAAK